MAIIVNGSKHCHSGSKTDEYCRCKEKGKKYPYWANCAVFFCFQIESLFHCVNLHERILFLALVNSSSLNNPLSRIDLSLFSSSEIVLFLLLTLNLSDSKE